MLRQPAARGPKPSGFVRIDDRITAHPDVLAAIGEMSRDLGVPVAELVRAALADVAIGAGYLAPQDRDRFVLAHTRKEH